VISDVVLDHVAVAVEHHADAFGRYVGELGARWVSSGPGVGFAPTQLAFGAGIRLELLEPHRVEDNDFLRRFLDRGGPGPHHLTFKVADLAAALAEADARGFQAVNVDLSQAVWKEAFLHPKQAEGILIQLAQVALDGTHRPERPDDLPAPPAGPPATLVHVGHAVASLADGMALFAGLLGGRVVARGQDTGSVWADLTWPAGGRLRLLEPDGPASALAGWIGELRGRVHHLALRFDHPGRVGAAVLRRDGVWEVAPADNHGMRLLIGAGRFPAVDQGYA
jgi:catechol 2,3-dioxygenase-like lactoylglutathione lyase family enzyme